MAGSEVNIKLYGPIDGQTWVDQWQRMLRWKVRLDDLYAGTRNFDAHAPLDYAYSFFVTCYHLADWLDRDDALDKLGARQFVRDDSSLAVCRDIANGHKHLVLDSRASAPDTTISHHGAIWIDSTRGDSVRASYQARIRWTDKEGIAHSEDCRVLIDSCVRAWERFIDLAISQGLPAAPPPQQ